MADQIIVLGPWCDGGDVWTRAVVSKTPPPGRFDLVVNKQASNCAACARELADAKARKQGVVLLNAEPGSLTGCCVRRVEVWPGRLAYYRRALNTPPIAAYLLRPPDALYQSGAWHGHGWSVRDLEGALIAHGPQTGPKAERLLLAALATLGVDVAHAGRMFCGASRNIVPETE